MVSRLRRLPRPDRMAGPGTGQGHATARRPAALPGGLEPLIAGYRAGATVYELAIQFGINRKTVSRTPHRKSEDADDRTDEAQIDEAQKLRREGWSLAQIGEWMHVDARTVHRRVARARRLLNIRLTECHPAIFCLVKLSTSNLQNPRRRGIDF